MYVVSFLGPEGSVEEDMVFFSIAPSTRILVEGGMVFLFMRS
jgi:hypothetical protein